MKVDARYRPVMRAAMQSEASGRVEVEGAAADVEVHRDEGGVARRIRYVGEGAPDSQVTWNGAAERPPFWPGDLPFLPGTHGVAWSNGAMWQRMGADFEDQVKAFGEKAQAMLRLPGLEGMEAMLGSMAERWRSLEGQERREVLKQDMEAITSRFGETMKTALGLGPELASDRAPSELARAALDFHHERGWVVESEPSEGAERVWIPARDGARRKIVDLRMPMIPQVSLSLTYL